LVAIATMSMKQTIKFVTGNKNKLREVAAFLKENETVEIMNVDLDCKYFSLASESFFCKLPSMLVLK